MNRRVVLSPQPRLARPVGDKGLYLTPNPRAAQALGVKYVSVDGYARRVLRQHGLLVASEIVRHHALREAARAVAAPPDLLGYTRVVRGAVQEVLRAGFPHRDPGVDVSERAREVLELTRHYLNALRNQQLVDPAAVLWTAAELGAEPRPLFVAGYPRLGLGELAFLEVAAGAESVLMLPDGSHASFRLNRDAASTLEAAGWVLEGSEAPLEPPGPLREFCPAAHVRAWRFASQEDEVRFVLTEVKALLHAGHAPESLALIARDDALYGPLLHDVAWEYEVPLKASYARPLRETRVGAWLELLVGVFRRAFPFEETARLLAHPFCSLLPREVWAKLRTVRPGGLAAWRTHVPLLEVLEWPAAATYTEHGDALFAALEALGVRERTDVSPRDRMSLTKIQRALDSLSPLTEAALPLEAFLGDLSELVSLLTLPADVATEGVELHTPLAVFGAQFDQVFVLGLAEGLLPAPVGDDPGLDFYERNRLAALGLELEGAVYAAHRETLSFWAALQTARRGVTLTYPERLGSGAYLPSAYFELLGLEPERPPSKIPASAEEFRQARLRHEVASFGAAPTDPVLHAAIRAWGVEQRREGSAPHDVYDGVTGIGVDPAAWRFSASQLVTLGSCAFGWFAGNVLRLAEPDEAEDVLSPGVRGTFYHHVLEATLRRVQDDADPRTAALEVMDEVFAEVEARLGLPALTEWPRTRRQHRTTLRRVLLSDDFWPEGSRVALLEQSFTGTWHGLEVRGVIDRVDATPDGLAFFDYKTRSTKPLGAKDTEGKRTLDVQLPLYVQAAAPQLFPDADVASASYYSLTRAKKLPPVTFDNEGLAAFVARVKQQLGAGSFPVEPDPDGSACTYCAFDLVCRKGVRLERKRAGESS